VRKPDGDGGCCAHSRTHSARTRFSWNLRRLRIGSGERQVPTNWPSGVQRPRASVVAVTPTVYRCYVRNGLRYGFFLEYDRGTESRRKYAEKFRAYYTYRDSWDAPRQFDGFPTLLFVTTQTAAEARIAEQAYRAWFVRGTEPLRVLITTTERIARNPERVLGRIWRTRLTGSPALDPNPHHWLP
jgi:hypothetical protein